MIRCDTDSLILHPFVTIKERTAGEYNIRIDHCPQCNLKKIVTMHGHTYYRSRVIKVGNASPISAIRYHKLYLMRR